MVGSDPAREVSFDLTTQADGRLRGGATVLSQMDPSSATIRPVRPPFDEAALLHLVQNLADRLLADAEPRGKCSWGRLTILNGAEHEAEARPHLGEPFGGKASVHVVGVCPGGEHQEDPEIRAGRGGISACRIVNHGVPF